MLWVGFFLGFWTCAVVVVLRWRAWQKKFLENYFRRVAKPR